MTDWTIETAEEEQTRQRSGVIDGRFQICHPDQGLVETADTLADAFAIADRCAAARLRDGRPCYGNPYAFEVFDRMARRGCPLIWQRQNKAVQHAFVKGDRYTEAAFWKVVRRREGK